MHETVGRHCELGIGGAAGAIGDIHDGGPAAFGLPEAEHDLEARVISPGHVDDVLGRSGDGRAGRVNGVTGNVLRR
jgi:hypothetical protein